MDMMKLESYIRPIKQSYSLKCLVIWNVYIISVIYVLLQNRMGEGY